MSTAINWNGLLYNMGKYGLLSHPVHSCILLTLPGFVEHRKPTILKDSEHDAPCPHGDGACLKQNANKVPDWASASKNIHSNYSTSGA